jgi:hypothetical protein
MLEALIGVTEQSQVIRDLLKEIQLPSEKNDLDQKIAQLE